EAYWPDDRRRLRDGHQPRPPSMRRASTSLVVLLRLRDDRRIAPVVDGEPAAVRNVVSARVVDAELEVGASILLRIREADAALIDAVDSVHRRVDPTVLHG